MPAPSNSSALLRPHDDSRNRSPQLLAATVSQAYPLVPLFHQSGFPWTDSDADDQGISARSFPMGCIRRDQEECARWHRPSVRFDQARAVPKEQGARDNTDAGGTCVSVRLLPHSAWKEERVSKWPGFRSITLQNCIFATVAIDLLPVDVVAVPDACCLSGCAQG